MGEFTYYKVIDNENGYSKYIRTNGLVTSIIYLGAAPKADAFGGGYRKQPDEVLHLSSEEEYNKMYDEYRYAPVSDQPNLNHKWNL